MPGNPIASFGVPTVIVDGATQTINAADGSYFVWTLGATRTASTFLNPAGGQVLTLELVQDATGSRLVTWPSNVSWAAGTAPTLTTTAAGIDVLQFIWQASAAKWRGWTVGKAYA